MIKVYPHKDLFHKYSASEESRGNFARLSIIAKHFDEIDGQAYPVPEFRTWGQPRSDLCYCTGVFRQKKYLIGAMVWAWRLKTVTDYSLVLMIEQGLLRQHEIEELLGLFDQVVEVPLIGEQADVRNTKHGHNTEKYPDLKYYFTKISGVNLTQYKRVLYLDALTLPTESLDELFDLPAPLGTYKPFSLGANFGGCFYLIIPDKKYYCRLRFLTDYYNEIYDGRPKHYRGGPDEVLLISLFYDTWNFYDNVISEERLVMCPEGDSKVPPMVYTYGYMKPWMTPGERYFNPQKIVFWGQAYKDFRVQHPECGGILSTIPETVLVERTLAGTHPRKFNLSRTGFRTSAESNTVRLRMPSTQSMRR